MRIFDPRHAAMLVLCAVWCCAGCGLPESQFADLFQSHPKVDAKDLAKYQKRYQTTRDKRALRWLLANAVQPGMSHAEVEGVLGEEGVREVNDRWLKTKGESYRMDDVIYCFGPDDAGRSVYLGFRDDQLVNFEPEEFSDSDDNKSKKKSRKRHKKRAEDDDEDA